MATEMKTRNGDRIQIDRTFPEPASSAVPQLLLTTTDDDADTTVAVLDVSEIGTLIELLSAWRRAILGDPFPRCCCPAPGCRVHTRAVPQ